MMRTQLLLVVQLALAAMLAYTCFCRAVKTDADTHREVRWAIWFEGLAAGLVFGTPLMPILMQPDGRNWSPSWAPGTTPLIVWLILLFAVTLVQLVTAKYWSAGRAPLAFQKSPREHAGGLVFAALLLVVGGIASVSPAHAASEWRQVEGSVVFMEPGNELRCDDEDGCYAFTRDGLAALLRQAGGSCGRTPVMPPPRAQRPGT